MFQAKQVLLLKPQKLRLNDGGCCLISGYWEFDIIIMRGEGNLSLRLLRNPVNNANDRDGHK